MPCFDRGRPRRIETPAALERGGVWALFAAAVAIRLFVALARTDIVWPDEHFQTIEPAYKLVFGHGLMTWEWTSGYRTWTVPFLYVPVVGLCKLIGIGGGLPMIAVCRAFTAVCASTLVFSLHALLRRLGVGPLAAIGAVGLFAFSASAAVWSATTLADTWSMLAVWWALPSLLRLVRDGSPSALFRVGFLAFLPVCVKIQMAPWTFGVLLLAYVSGKPGARYAFMALGAFAGLAALGAFEAATWGGFYPSVLMQIRSGDGISHLFGVSPWWGYFPLWIKEMGPFDVAIAALLGVVAVASRRARRCVVRVVRRRADEWALVFVPLALFAAFLAYLGHKEARYLLPTTPAVYVGAALFLQALRPRLKGTAPWTRIRSIPVAWRGGAFLALALATGYRTTQVRLPFTSVDVARLENAIRLQRSGGSDRPVRLLLCDLNWAWTRGATGVGGPLVEREVSTDGEIEAASHEFDYAIARQGTSSRLDARSGWRVVATQGRYELLGRAAP